MLVYEGRHDGDGGGAWALEEDLSDFLVLETDHILSIHLRQVVVDENAIAEEGGRLMIIAVLTSPQSRKPYSHVG